MKIKFIAVALLISLMAVGCQKETLNSDFALEQTSSVRKVVYYIDGEEFRITLRGDFEWQQFVSQMIALAREGHSVSFFNENITSASQIKDVVTYHTDSEDDANRWSREMSDKGYTVVIEYDKDTHIYTCTAVKP